MKWHKQGYQLCSSHIHQFDGGLFDTFLKSFLVATSDASADDFYLMFDIFSRDWFLSGLWDGTSGLFGFSGFSWFLVDHGFWELEKIFLISTFKSTSGVINDFVTLFNKGVEVISLCFS